MAQQTTTTTIPQLTNNPNELAKPTVIRFNIDQQCPVQYVTVYNDRAEVTRQLKHHFDNEGIYDLVLEGFSNFVEETSLHVSGGTGKACTILEVSYQTRHDNPPPSADLTSLDILQTQLETLQKDIDIHQRQLTRLNKQRSWIDGRSTKLMNQEGPCTKADTENMQHFLEFYQNTLTKLDDEAAHEEDELKKLKSQQESLKAQISQHGSEGAASRRKTFREMTITVHIASNQLDVALEVSYLIGNCSWSARYDVRVSTIDPKDQRTQLTYNGIIENKSQENWPNAHFSLSTAKPSLGGTPPKLTTLKIDYYRPPIFHGGEDYDRLAVLDLPTPPPRAPSAMRNSNMPIRRLKGAFKSFKGRAALTAYDPTIEDDDDNNEISDAQVNVLASKTEASMSSTSFVIPRQTTIDADGKPHKVTIGVLDLTSTFTYTVVPKLSLHAYLKASTVNTSDKLLLSGPVAVFMDNNFITNSWMENVCVGDTFELPLGIDAGVKVEYKPEKKMAETHGVISKVNHEAIRHETRVVNMKPFEITLFVHEQVPLSSDEKIKVKLVSPDVRQKEYARNCTVTLNDKNNLEWKCSLSSRGEISLPLEYRVEWPKDRRVEYKEDQC